ncbi:hypothetical protein DFQ27_005863 [Actinomortierella ambigua]|uniref:Uncharacterized protein n=1 Tax=Actinomortierella ambigua TaxID=1343610 RepID=A0A9P6PXM5_9FUNG|nr:hypothetical protein DFQ27_005863 [Actinomortierella ambigua]
MSTTNPKNARLLAFMIVFITTISFFLNLLLTLRLQSIFGKLPWELILRPLLEASIIVYYAYKLLRHRLFCFGHHPRHQGRQRPTSRLLRNLRTAIYLCYVLFWFALNCRVAIALTKAVGEQAFATSEVTTFRCEDHRWASFCQARNGTLVFGIIGSVLAAIEIYVCYRIDGLPRDESIELDDTVEMVVGEEKLEDATAPAASAAAATATAAVRPRPTPPPVTSAITTTTAT